MATYTRFIVLDENDNNKINLNIEAGRYQVVLQSYMFSDYLAVPEVEEPATTEIKRDVYKLDIDGLQLGNGNYPLLIRSSSFSKINAYYIECFVKNQHSYTLKSLYDGVDYPFNTDGKIILIFQLSKII